MSEVVTTGVGSSCDAGAHEAATKAKANKMSEKRVTAANLLTASLPPVTKESGGQYTLPSWAYR